MLKRYRLKASRYVRPSGDLGTEYWHRLRAEKALGKPLASGVEVHHADGTKNDSSPLVICQDRAYHMLLHRRMRIIAAGGNPDLDKICSGCRKPKRKATEYCGNRCARDGIHNYCLDCLRVQREQKKPGIALRKRKGRVPLVLRESIHGR